MTTQQQWCRKVEGQEHDLVLKEDGHPPHCQPLRDWVRDMVVNRPAGDPPPLAHTLRQLLEEWECFHWEQCARCRKKTRLQIFRDECPTAKPGATIIADPPQ